MKAELKIRCSHCGSTLIVEKGDEVQKNEAVVGLPPNSLFVSCIVCKAPVSLGVEEWKKKKQ